MDLRVYVVFLFFFLTGGYSLRCYMCASALMGSCEAIEQTCPVGVFKCKTRTTDQSMGSAKVSVTTKGCASQCDPGTQKLPTGGTKSVHCCDTDLCNAADGVYKGSFLLLFSPLLFYFLILHFRFYSEDQRI